MRAARAPFKTTRAPRYHCPVGRGDPTPPGCFAATRNYRQVCRGRIYASRAVYPLCCAVGMAATGGMYAAPTNDPLCCCNRKTAGGAYPAPTARWFFLTHSTDTRIPTRSKCVGDCSARPPPSYAGGGYSHPRSSHRRSSSCPRRPPKFSRAPAPWTGCG